MKIEQGTVPCIAKANRIKTSKTGNRPCAIKTVFQERNTDMVTLCKLFYTQIKIENMNMQ